MVNETRSIQIAVRITPTMKRALEKAAKDDHRSVAGYVEVLLAEKLKEGGYLK